MSATTFSKVLVIAAHPDDEILGCGGTMARHVQDGDSVDILFIADGVGARQPDPAAHEIEARIEAARRAAKIVGANAPSFLAFSDQMLDTYPLIDIVRGIEDAIAKVQPHIIYTHDFSDLNLDHALTHRAVMTAARPQPGRQIAFIYAFECLSSTEWSADGEAQRFSPNHFVDITPHLQTKIDALKPYHTEMRAAPHARSFENVKNLAHYRGCSVGVHAAEAFRLIRAIRSGS